MNSAPLLNALALESYLPARKWNSRMSKPVLLTRPLLIEIFLH